MRAKEWYSAILVIAVSAALVTAVPSASADLSSTDHDEFFDALVPGFGAEGTIGSELLFADVNGDGYDDMIMGAPDATVRGRQGAGAVTIVPGSPTGLVPGDRERWTRASRGVDGVARRNQAFGESVVTGDFDGDGFEDLAVGAPDASIARAHRTGVVHVLPGSARGIRARGDQRWHEGVDGVPGRRGAGDRFGAELAAGDFNGDGFDDLVVKTRHGGAVALLMLNGSQRGLTASGSRIVTTVAGEMPAYTLDFATAATADLEANGFDDLLIGSPGGAEASGVVTLWSGSPQGLEAESMSRLFGPVDENLGLTLDVTDLDDDGWLDVVASGVRQLRIALGSKDGLRSSMSDRWPYHQGTCCWGGKGRFVPRFNPGEVVVGDFDGDRLGDIVVGRRWAGMYLRGADVLWTRGPDIVHFGEGVRAVGDPDGDGVDDVAAYRVNDGRRDPDTGELLPFVTVRYGTRTLTCAGQPITVYLARGDQPTDGDDVILGTRRDDRISGGGGDDLICGRSGDDRINGGEGHDTIYAGAGEDRVFGGPGRDTLYGGVGADRLEGGRGADTLRGGDGDDVLEGDTGRDSLHGERGADALFGGPGDDLLTGDRFEDVMRFGLEAVDTCDGGSGVNHTWDC